MDYHSLYLKMFGVTADAVDVLDSTIKMLSLLRTELILAQQAAEDEIIQEND